MLFHSYACIPVKLIHITHFHIHRVPPKRQWQSPSSSQQPPRRGGHQEDSRYKPTVRMSGQGFGWGRGGGGRGEEWALAGCWGFDVPMRRKGQRSLAECQWKTQTFFSSSILSRVLSSVPRGHHRPKRTHARSVALLGKQKPMVFLLRLLLREGNEGKTITEEHLLFVGHHDKHSVGLKNLKYLWGLVRQHKNAKWKANWHNLHLKAFKFNF